MRGEHGIETLRVRDARQRAADVERAVDVRHHPHRPQLRQRLHDLAQARQAIDLLPRVPVPIGGHEHRGGNLTEAVEHPLGPEVGGATRPGGAE